MPLTSDLKQCYILHSRSYRETSFILDLFTRELGRVSVLARGIKKSKSSWQGLLQPFIALKVTWRGKGDLPTLTQVEQDQLPHSLFDTRLFSGFYLNELIIRLLHRYDPHEKLFDAYEIAIQQLAQCDLSEQISLRHFEKNLLTELGYALELRHVAGSRLPIEHNHIYRFVPDKGFLLEQNHVLMGNQPSLFLGEHLIAIADNNYVNKEILSTAKRLMRLALYSLLGDKPLKSRELFGVLQKVLTK